VATAFIGKKDFRALTGSAVIGSIIGSIVDLSSDRQVEYSSDNKLNTKLMDANVIRTNSPTMRGTTNIPMSRAARG
tara:strand:- start:88 stop:315 length:228 start_codon:yes stop_codon:yes gene_type:complete